jgi:hypothetical protein
MFDAKFRANPGRMFSTGRQSFQKVSWGCPLALRIPLISSYANVLPDFGIPYERTSITEPQWGSWVVRVIASRHHSEERYIALSADFQSSLGLLPSVDLAVPTGFRGAPVAVTKQIHEVMTAPILQSF